MKSVRIDAEFGGWPVSLTWEGEEISPDDVKGEIEAWRTSGFEARRYGGRNGGGDRAAEAWALVTGIRAFSHEGKGVLEIEMAPEAGQFGEARSAMCWEGEKLAGKMPGPMAEAVRKAWSAGDKRGTKFGLSTIRLECGFWSKDGKLRACDLREAGQATGSGLQATGTAAPEKVASF